MLTAARVELHRTTGRATDRLLLQEQDQVAAALDYADADALMAAIAEAGRTIAWVADDVWRRRRRGRWPASRAAAACAAAVPAGRRGAGRPASRGAGGGPSRATRPARQGEVVLGADADVDGDPALPLRIAAVAAERWAPHRPGHPRRPGRAALPPRPTRGPTTCASALVRVLATGPPAIAALEALDQRGLLVRLIPEWAAVRNRPQRNAFHRFTVDRHLLEAAAEAAALAPGGPRPTSCSWAPSSTTSARASPATTPTPASRSWREMGPAPGLRRRRRRRPVSLVRNHLAPGRRGHPPGPRRPRHRRRRGRGGRRPPRLELLAASPKPTAWPPVPRPGGRGKRGWWPTWCAGSATPWLVGGHRPALLAVTDRHRGFMEQVERLGRSIVTAEAPTVTVVARTGPGCWPR